MSSWKYDFVPSFDKMMETTGSKNHLKFGDSFHSWKNIKGNKENNIDGLSYSDSFAISSPKYHTMWMYHEMRHR